MADQFFECERCFHQYNHDERKPKYLSCRHCICLTCAKKIAAKATKISCSTCSAETLILIAGDVENSLETNQEKLTFLGLANKTSSARQVKWCMDCHLAAVEVCFLQGHVTIDMGELVSASSQLALECRKNWNEAKSIRTTFQTHVGQLRASLKRLDHQLQFLEENNASQLAALQTELKNLLLSSSSNAEKIDKSASDLKEAQKLPTNMSLSDELRLSITIGGSVLQLGQSYQINSSTRFQSFNAKSGDIFSWRDARNLVACLVSFIDSTVSSRSSSASGINSAFLKTLDPLGPSTGPKTTTPSVRLATQAQFDPVTETQAVNTSLLESFSESVLLEPSVPSSTSTPIWPIYSSEAVPVLETTGKSSIKIDNDYQPVFDIVGHAAQNKQSNVERQNNLGARTMAEEKRQEPENQTKVEKLISLWDSQPLINVDSRIATATVPTPSTNRRASFNTLNQTGLDRRPSNLYVTPKPMPPLPNMLNRKSSPNPLVQTNVDDAIKINDVSVESESPSNSSTSTQQPNWIAEPYYDLPCEPDEIYFEEYSATIERPALTGPSYCTWNPTSDWLASTDATISFYNLAASQTPTKTLQLKHYDDPVCQIAWATDNSLATGSKFGCVRLWKIEEVPGELEALCTLKEHFDEVTVLKFNKNGSYLLSGGADAKLIAWNTKTKNLQQHFQYNEGVVSDLDWKDNFIFAVALVNGTVFVGKIGSEIPLQTFQRPWGKNVRWDPTGTLLAMSSVSDAAIQVWNYDSLNVVQYTGHTQPSNQISWISIPATKKKSELKYLASCASDGQVWVWNTSTQKELFNGSSKDNTPILCLSFSPDGSLLATGTQNGSVGFWNVKKGKLIANVQAGNTVSHLSWSPSSQKLRAVMDNGRFRVLRKPTPKRFSRVFSDGAFV